MIWGVDLERDTTALPDKFQLYRVFDFSVQPMVYVLPGALSRICQLQPMVYRATLAARTDTT